MQPAGPRAGAEQITVEVVKELIEPRNKKQTIPNRSESLPTNHLDLKSPKLVINHYLWFS